MIPLISDARFDSLVQIVLASIAIIPATLAAKWGYEAKKNSGEAKDNSQAAKADSAEAKVNSARALHEVSTNGGMSDPNPNLNDHVKYQTQMTEFLVETVKEIRAESASVRSDLDKHLGHAALMDQALAELYLQVRPETKEWPQDDST